MTPLAANALSQFDIEEEPLEIHIFSKHLQFLEYQQAAQKAAEMGFDGLDITVRPNGHVLPENVKSELPEFINAIRNVGLKCDLITTNISDASDPLDRNVIDVASAQGVKFYRSDWFKYRSDFSMEESLIYYQAKVRELGMLNQENNIVGCYQNHSGTSIGSSFWEINHLLKSVNTNFFGAQYDIRHAVVEGGKSWPNGVRLLGNRIKTIVLKDFKWEVVDGQWDIVNVPIGEGMVDFISYFRLLKSFGLRPPVSLHLEYPLGGAEKGKVDISVNQKVVFDAMQRDLNKVKELWKKA
ncbi:MAG: sugar phosphate isomerase/epimerase family protein [Marinoscillum sp.]